MEGIQLKVAIRRETRKGAVRRLRAQGLIPAICYGGNTEPLALTVDPFTLRKALDPEKRTNTVLELHVEGQGAPKEPIFAMIREYQQHPLKNEVRHVDFIRISADKPVDVKVPLVFTGKAVGVKMGGQLNQVFREIPIRCLPQQIPSKIEHDVTDMDLGDLRRAKDIDPGPGIMLMLAPQQTVLSLTMGRAEEEEAPKVAEAAEGATAEEGAAPPAEGEAAAADKTSDRKADKTSDRRADKREARGKRDR